MHDINIPNGGLNGYRWVKAADGTWTFTVYTDATEALCLDVSTFALKLVVNPVAPLTGTQLTKATGGGITVSGVFNSDPRLNLQRAVVAWAAADTADANAYPPGQWHATLWRNDSGAHVPLAEGNVYLVQLDTLP